jgi:hypothetical protein
MSMNNAYVTEEYLHRRIADVLRDAAKLQEDLNQSETQVSISTVPFTPSTNGSIRSLH